MFEHVQLANCQRFNFSTVQLFNCSTLSDCRTVDLYCIEKVENVEHVEKLKVEQVENAEEFSCLQLKTELGLFSFQHYNFPFCHLFNFSRLKSGSIFLIRPDGPWKHKVRREKMVSLL